MKINLKNKIIISFLITVVAVESFNLFFNFSSAQAVTQNQSPRQIEMTAFIVNKENKEITNKQYDVIFSIYPINRTDASQPLGAPLWQETQKVNIENGILKAYLGAVTPLSANLNFARGGYYLGIKIGTDSEMTPREKIGAVPLAISALNASSVSGAAPGTATGNLVVLGKGGKINIKNLPTGTSGNTLVLTNDSRLNPKIKISGQSYISASGLKLTLDQINLGTDITGTLPSSHGGTGVTSYNAGDILYSDSSNSLSALPIGSVGEVLTVSGGAPVWQSPGAAGLIDGSGTAGYVTIWSDANTLTSEQYLSEERGGTGIGSYNEGDMLYYHNGNMTKLGIGSNGQIMGVVGNLPAWQNSPFVGAHGLLSLSHPDTVAASPLRGDMITGIDTGGGNIKWERYAIGAAGEILMVNGSGDGINWLPSTNITELGTITAGTWNADVISDAYVANNLTINNGTISNSTISGSSISSSDINLTQSTNPTPTAEGRIEWDTDNDRLVVGNGSGQTIFNASGVTMSGVYNYITLSGQDIIRGQVDLTTDVTGTLPAGNGGTGVATLTSGGVLYGNGAGAVQATSVGTGGQILLVNGSNLPELQDVTGDILISDSGVTTIQANSVALTTDTTGNYVATITAGNGISGSSSSEGGTPTLALSALTSDWNQTGAYDIVLSNTSSELKIMGSGGTYYGIFDVGNITSSDKTYTFPDTSGTVALTSDLHNPVTLDTTAHNYLSLAGQQITLGAIDLTTGTGDVTGILSVANGGTGRSALTSNALLYGNGTGALNLASGTSGQVLIANSSNVPTFTTVSGDISIDGAGLATIQADSVALTTDTAGNYVTSITNGNGLSGGNGGSEGATLTLGINLLSSVDGAGSTSSYSGLEFQGTGNNELTLLQGCSADEVLSWDNTNSIWKCASVAGVGGVTGTGTNNYVTYWTGTSSLAAEQYLNVSRGGTGVGTFGGTNTILYTTATDTLSSVTAGTNGQLLVANATGVPTFVTMSGDVTLANDGTTTIQANSVALTTDTTGNYVATITAGNGISGSSSSEGGTPTLALSALTSDWNQTGAYDIVLSNASSELKIMESTGGTYYGSFDIGDLNADRTYTFPDATGTVALGSSTANYVAYWNSANTLSGVTGTSGILTTNGSGVPSIGTDIPTAVTIGGSYIYRAGGTDIPVTDGGTGRSTLTQNGVLYGNGSSAVGVTSAGSNAAMLLSVSGTPTFVSMSGDVNITNTGVTTIQPDAVGSSEIADNTMAEADLNITNHTPANSWILSYDATSGGFTWVANNGGSGASLFTDAGSYTYLTSTGDDLVIGGNATDQGFFFDVSASTLSFEGSTADSYETTLGVIDPTADNAINFPNNSGTVALTSDLHNAVSVAAGLDYLSINASAQVITLSQIDLTTDVTGLLPPVNGGTGLDTSASTGVPTISSGAWTIASSLGVPLGGTGVNSEAALESKVENYIFDADAETITGAWTVADNVNFNFGTGGAIQMYYDATTDNRLEFSDGSNLLGALSDAGTVGNLYLTGGISTFDNTVTAGYGEFTGLCLGNGTSCITSWGSVSGVGGSGAAGAAAFWEDANTLGAEPQLATSRGGTGIDTSTSSGVATVSSGTWTIASALGVTTGGTGTTTQFTQGSVVFAGASGIYSQDNANFFYDATNHRLGLGTTSPSALLDVAGTARMTGF